MCGGCHVTDRKVDFNCIDWHWHAEFEFVYIEAGMVHFHIGEKNFDLSKGQGIFINSRVLHKMHSENNATIPNFLFLPSLIAPTESLIYSDTKIWELITSNVVCCPKIQSMNSSSLARLQMMMQFIHLNYTERISLLDIAKAGNVSTSTALNLFRNVLNTSPVNYLICYRLKEAALLLSNTEKKVSAISIDTGFSNKDYFCRSFKRVYSLTPSEYRRAKK